MLAAPIGRVRQAIYFARANSRPAPVLPARAEALLTPALLQQFRILPTGDQRHLLRVYRYLVAHDADEDTVTAGLIHDIGKACRACNITVAHRSAHVLLSRFLPGAYRRFAAMPEVPDVLRSLHVLATHPQRGASAARQAGYNPRVCQLIRDHESGGASDDAGLQLLRKADDTADARWDTDHP